MDDSTDDNQLIACPCIQFCTYYVQSAVLSAKSDE